MIRKNATRKSSGKNDEKTYLGKLDLTKKIEIANVADLKPHPRNYRDHPDDQIAHLIESIKSNGFYRNVVAAKDNVILAGHGVVKAAMKIGLKQIPVVRLNIDSEDEQALKVLAGDNEMARLAVIDDRALTELLKELGESDNLLGTGFDESMLAALTFVTRPATEIKDKNEAGQWAGMPEYGDNPNIPKMIISFRNEKDRLKFAKILSIEIPDPERLTISAWWPPRERRDLASVEFEG